MSGTRESQGGWQPLRVESLPRNRKDWPIRSESDEVLHATRNTATQIGLPPRAFTLFPSLINKQRVTFAMPSAEIPSRTVQRTIYEREGWPEDWPDDIDRAFLARAQIGFGPDWKPAPCSALQLDFELGDGTSREVPPSAAEAFELDPVGWVLTPVKDTAAPRTIACPLLHVARETLGEAIRQGFETVAAQHPAGAPPGWLDELLVLERSGRPESWPGSETAWQRCEPYAGPTPSHLLS